MGIHHIKLITDIIPLLLNYYVSRICLQYTDTFVISLSLKLILISPCFHLFLSGSILSSEASRFSEFKFLQEPEDVVVVRNRPAILNCEASLTGSGNARPLKIKWKRDGEFLNFPDFNDRR